MRKTWIPACAGTTTIKTGLAIALVLATAPAWAEWVKVGHTRTAVHYVDPSTVQKDGNLRQVWALQDMVLADDDGIRSIRALQEHDCAGQRIRYLTVTAHSAPMAGGWVLLTHELSDTWSNRSPGTRASAVGKIVCGK